MASVEASSDAPRGERSAGWAGIAFVALSTLWVVVVSIVGAPQLSQATTEEFASFYDDQDNRISLILASLGFALAGFALLWFLGGLRSVLRRAEGEDGTLSTTVVVSGAALGGLLFVFNAINVAVAWALEESDNFQFDPNSAQLFEGLSYLLAIQGERPGENGPKSRARARDARRIDDEPRPSVHEAARILRYDALARSYPRAEFVHVDATQFDGRPESFDAVVSLFMLGHVPREEQGPLLRRIAHWLRPGGLLLTT